MQIIVEYNRDVSVLPPDVMAQAERLRSVEQWKEVRRSGRIASTALSNQFYLLLASRRSYFVALSLSPNLSRQFLSRPERSSCRVGVTEVRIYERSRP